MRKKRGNRESRVGRRGQQDGRAGITTGRPGTLWSRVGEKELGLSGGRKRALVLCQRQKTVAVFSFL